MACLIFFFFFFNDTATTEIYTLSLHDALPIFVQGNYFGTDKTGNALLGSFGTDVYEYPASSRATIADNIIAGAYSGSGIDLEGDRKSTRLNSSHLVISYAVFCLKKKKYSALSSLSTRSRRLLGRTRPTRQLDLGEHLGQHLVIRPG